jgi:hypothetical protein
MLFGMDTKNPDNYWGYGTVLAVTATTIVVGTGAKDLSREYTRIVY